VEHIDGQEAFLDEIARVLAPDGLLLISCPNKLEYSDRRGFTNAFHVKELYRDELDTLITRRFRHARWFGQRPSFFSVIAPEPGPEAGHLAEVSEANPAQAATALAEPLYFVVAATRSAATLGMLPAALSVLADRDDWVHRDYEKVMRELGITVARGEALEKQVAQREAAVQALRGDVDAARQEAAANRDAIADRERRIVECERRIAECGSALVAKDAEILRRRGLRWWLKLPFIRLGLLRE